MRKKIIAHAVDPGSVAMASGYTIKTSPGPERNCQNIYT
jgi:hypothetical protein